ADQPKEGVREKGDAEVVYPLVYAHNPAGLDREYQACPGPADQRTSGPAKADASRQSILWCAAPFPTYPIDGKNPNPIEYAVLARRSQDEMSSSSVLGQIGHAIRNVFDWRLLWDVFRSWWDTIRNNMPEFPPDDGEHFPGGDGDTY